MKYYDKNKESLYLKYWGMNSLYGWVMSQKLPLGDFKWVEETLEITKDFLKIYNEDSNIVYFVEADVQYFEKLHEL